MENRDYRVKVDITINAMRLLGIILIILKLTSKIDWSWFLVITPLVVDMVIDTFSKRKKDGNNKKQLNG
jgi:hypothetical protein